MTPYSTTRRVAEAASAALYRNHGSDRIDIALGTVAALSIDSLTSPAPRRADLFADLDESGTAAVLREAWTRMWLAEPYLVQTALPLHSWLNDDPDSDTLRAARAVGEAALRAGLLDLVAHADPAARSTADVLGTILTHMRSRGSRQVLGEFHTPPDVADLMARIVTDRLPDPGRAVVEPCAGSGGLIRALAQNIRRLGGNPADYVWVMGDIDALAVASAATNAILWGLGPRVLVYRADALAEPNAPQKAEETRRAVLEHHHRIVQAAHRFAAIELLIRETSQPARGDDAA